MKNIFKAITGQIEQRRNNRQAAVSAMKGNFETALGLVQNGADPNFQMSYTLAVMFDTYTVTGNVGCGAVHNHNVAALGRLLDLGLDKDIMLQVQKHSLLHEAIRMDSTETALLLIERGASIHDAKGNPAAYWLAKDMGLKSIVDAIEAREQRGQPAPAHPAKEDAQPMKLSGKVSAPKTASFRKQPAP